MAKKGERFLVPIFNAVKKPTMKQIVFLFGVLVSFYSMGQQTQKPPLHGRDWMAITGKPLAATAGATLFQKGGNAVDAALATAIALIAALGQLRLRFDERRFGLRTIELDEYRARGDALAFVESDRRDRVGTFGGDHHGLACERGADRFERRAEIDRKSTRLNSSH